MEIILAIVVATAVIFFGALISMGNEQQRKAIDDLREQVVLWAMQDLRIKRENLSRDVRVDDPLMWLDKIITKILKDDPNLRIADVFENPQVLVCTTADNRKIFFSPLSPTEIQRTKHNQRAKLSQFANRNPLIYIPKRITTYQLSNLNSGILFDLELKLAWKKLMDQDSEIDSLWMYII